MKTCTSLLFAAGLLLSAHGAEAQKIALVGFNLLDMENLKVVRDQTLVMEGSQILALGARQSLKLDSNTTRVDLSGKYLLPGLIDAHTHHGTEPEGGDNPQLTKSRLQALLRGGVTTVRDMGGDIRVLRHWQRLAQLDEIQSPDIYYSVIIGGVGFFSDPRTQASAKGAIPGQVDWMRAVDDNTDFDALMQRTLGTGATGIKIYAQVPAHLIRKLSGAAKRHGVKVWSHAYIGPDKPSDVIEAGVETISHTPDLSAQIIPHYENWRRKDLPIDNNTLAASLAPASYTDLLNTLRDKGTILDATISVFEQLKDRNNNSASVYQHTAMLTRLAHQAGVTIAAGTDFQADKAGLPYPMLHHELQLLVDDAGMTPLQALQAATLNGAKVLGMQDNIGSIGKGKMANILVLNQDPSQNIQHSRDIYAVIKHGHFVYRGDDARLPFVSARKAAGMLYMSGQIGNFPGTLTLAGEGIDMQMHQTMQNIGAVLKEHNLGFNDVVKCTLMLADIGDWAKASEVYKSYFQSALPARSAFAAAGLALNAKVEVECLAALR